MFKNVASQKIAVFMFDVTTGLAKTGDAAQISVYVSKDYGTVTQLTDTSATEMDATNAKGWYLFDVSQTETNADALLFTGKSSSSANYSVVGQLIYTVPPLFTTLSIDSSGRAKSDVDTIKTNPVVNGGTITFPTTATLASTTNITAGTITTVSGNVTGSVGSVTGAVGSVTGAVASVTGAVGSVTGNVGGNVTGTIGGLTAVALADFFDTNSGTTYASAVAGSVVKEIGNNAGTLTAADIADAVWDEATTAHTTSGTFGEQCKTDIDAILVDTGTTLDAAIAALPTANANADALLDRTSAVETGLTPRSALKLISAATAGKLSGGATTTNTIRNAVADSKNRIVATVDADGNRTAITYDVT